MAYRFAKSRKVNVATVCGVPGVERTVIMFSFHFTFIIPSAYAGFSDIVNGGPNKISYDIGMLLRHAIVAPCVFRIRFGLHHHAGGYAVIVSFRLVNHIIVADNVVFGRKGVINFPIRIPWLLALDNLLANTPANYRRVVAVAHHHCRHIFCRPFIEQQMIVMTVFRIPPAVECFVNDKQSYFIAGIEECLRGNIVRSADRIEAGLFEHLGLTSFGPIVGSRPKYAVVVVNAPSVEQYLFPIEAEAVGGRPA